MTHCTSNVNVDVNQPSQNVCKITQRPQERPLRQRVILTLTLIYIPVVGQFGLATGSGGIAQSNLPLTLIDILVVGQFGLATGSGGITQSNLPLTLICILDSLDTVQGPGSIPDGGEKFRV